MKRNMSGTHHAEQFDIAKELFVLSRSDVIFHRLLCFEGKSGSSVLRVL